MRNPTYYFLHLEKKIRQGTINQSRPQIKKSKITLRELKSLNYLQIELLRTNHNSTLNVFNAIMIGRADFNKFKTLDNFIVATCIYILESI